MRKIKFIKKVGHALMWLVLLGLPFTFFIEDRKFNVKWVIFSPFYWLFSISFGLLFYFNYYFLVPRFYLKGKYSQFALILLLLFAAFYLVKPFILMFRYYLTERGVKLEPHSILKVDAMTCVLFVILTSLGLVVQVIREWRLSERKVLQAEAEKARAELSFLKAQVNPHFLYNTLNNIYSLSLDHDPDTSESILKLSNLMRYVTDEATKDFVPLEHEIACIRDYIDLQKMRLEENIHVDFAETGDPEDKQIAPMILITYIENAFKYGVSSREEATITIRTTVEENTFTFFCQNKIFPTQKAAERTGIGLENTRQRLRLLYPNKHTLNINTDNGFYTVELTLQT